MNAGELMPLKPFDLAKRDAYAARILPILAKHDVEGLIAAGAPADEYESEAEAIAATLVLRAHPVIGPWSVRKVFWFYFGTGKNELTKEVFVSPDYGLSLEPDAWLKIAIDINAEFKTEREAEAAKLPLPEPPDAA